MGRGSSIVIAGMLLGLAAAAPTSLAAMRRNSARRPAASLMEMATEWARERYRGSEAQVVVAGCVLVIGLLLRVPWLTLFIGTGAFVAYPLVKDLAPEQWVKWAAIVAVAFLMGHYLLTLFGVIGRDHRE